MIEDVFFAAQKVILIHMNSRKAWRNKAKPEKYPFKMIYVAPGGLLYMLRKGEIGAGKSS